MNRISHNHINSSKAPFNNLTYKPKIQQKKLQNNQTPHVTFQSFPKCIDSSGYSPHEQSKYNYKYGIQNRQNAVPVQLNQQISHIVYQEYNDLMSGHKKQEKKSDTIPLSFNRNQNQANSIKRNENRPLIWNKSRSRSKNHKLKIFPQQHNKQLDQNTMKQIQRLKNQIQLLKESFKNLSKINTERNNLSQTHNTNSINFSLLQQQRKRRLSNLNAQNQSLFNTLAWKLKQLSQEQYQDYLAKSRLNEKFLNEIFDHSSSAKQKNVNLSPQKNDFIDIHQFETLYQDSLSMTKKSHDKPNLKEQKVLQSPFLLKQNNQAQFRIQYNEANNSQPYQQAYTFHKNNNFIRSGPVKYKHFNSKIQSNIQKKLLNQIEMNEILKRTKPKQKDSRVDKKRMINDFNMTLEDKINRKRAMSAFRKG